MSAKQKWESTIALLVAVVSFSLSVFNFQNSMFLAGWIAPFAMMRFTRKSKWWVSGVVGVIALQIAVMLGTLPFMGSVEGDIGMTSGELLYMQFRNGFLFLAPNALIPFLLDKAFYKKLPPLAGSFIYPLSVLVIDLIVTLLTGGMVTIGETQIHIQPMMGMTSLIGVLGVGFLVSWFAPVMNLLWEERGRWGRLGGLRWGYPIVMAVLFLYGGLYITYPQKARGVVKIAGITTRTRIDEKMSAAACSLKEFSQLSPAEYGDIINSSEEDINRLKAETLKAIGAGAKVIIWQEFAFHAPSADVSSLIEEMKEVARASGVYIVVSFGEVLSPEKRTDLPLANKSILITSEGTIGWDYGKTKVNPGYEDLIYEGGDGNIPFVDTPFGRMGVAICADGIYQHFIRQVYAKDIDLLVIPSWDSTTSTPKITDCTDIRAVEFGYTSVRIAGEGLSTVSDPYYRRWAQMNSFEPLGRGFVHGKFLCQCTHFLQENILWRCGVLVPVAILHYSARSDCMGAGEAKK